MGHRPLACGAVVLDRQAFPDERQLVEGAGLHGFADLALDEAFPRRGDLATALGVTSFGAHCSIVSRLRGRVRRSHPCRRARPDRRYSKAMTPLPESPRVRLRDVTLDDADLLDAWNWERSEFNDFAFEPEPIDRDVLARGPLRNEHNGHAHRRGHRRGPADRYRRLAQGRYGPNPESDALNFGIELIPDARGLGYGTEAQVLLLDYLFSETASTAWRRRPTSRTSPNSVPSRRPASVAKASSGAPSSGPAPITTSSSTRGSATIRTGRQIELGLTSAPRRVAVQ